MDQAVSADTNIGPGSDKQWFGHPRGLSTLFFTELWERFSYYGMRTLLILYMTDAVAGGMGIKPEQAGAIYGLYTFGVYALALPGGWIADRLIGQRKAVLYGGVFIAAGHYSMAVPSTFTFYLGLALIVIGTGLLKPNVSAIVGDLYKGKGARRDAGFSIFYMGINIGALAGPFFCSLVGEPRSGTTWTNWHYGFALAGIGMTLALVQYVVGGKYLAGAGELKDDSAEPQNLADAKKKFTTGLAVVVVTILAAWGLSAAGYLPITLVTFAQTTGAIVVVLAAAYFAYVIAFVCRDATERKRIGLCALLFVGAAMFWSGFEQAGSSMNLVARDVTDRVLFGMEIPAGMLQSVNPFFIIVLAPIIGMAWVWLGRHNPSIPIKFGLGLVLLGAGFYVMSWASAEVVEGGKMGMRWLIATYFLHTVGELCLSPVGLSSTTKLAPDRLVGQMMGTWFMGAALGNLIAGLVAGYIEAMPLSQLFGTVATIVGIAGLAFLVLAKPMGKLAVGIK
ncbi:MAG: peptide MFS transporter [Acidobacteriota bacterium]|nr:peptide MFS transporter [Acidobacteriota bacterium]